MTTKDESIKKRQERIRRCQLLKEELENYNSRPSFHLGQPQQAQQQQQQQQQAQLNTNNGGLGSNANSFSVPVSAESKEPMNNDAVLFPRRPVNLPTDTKPATNDYQGMLLFHFAFA